MSLLLALVSQPAPRVVVPEQTPARGNSKRRKKYRFNGKYYDADSEELALALQEALEAEKEEPRKKQVIRIAKGVPVYRVKYPEYPKFEAMMQELKYQGEYELARKMLELMERQREIDEEEAIFALLH